MVVVGLQLFQPEQLELLKKTANELQMINSTRDTLNMLASHDFRSRGPHDAGAPPGSLVPYADDEERVSDSFSAAQAVKLILLPPSPDFESGASHCDLLKSEKELSSFTQNSRFCIRFTHHFINNICRFSVYIYYKINFTSFIASAGAHFDEHMSYC